MNNIDIVSRYLEPSSTILDKAPEKGVVSGTFGARLINKIITEQMSRCVFYARKTGQAGVY